MERSRLEKIYNAMKLIDLKKHLRNRGVSVNSHLKPGLVAIACAVEEMKLPLIHRINKEEEQLNVNRHLFIHGIQLTDPFKANAVNDFKNSPPFGLFDIFNHLIYHSCEYDKQGLAAYKSYEDYRLFRDGYVESLLTYYSKDAGVHVYVGKVKPAMKAKTKEGKEFYDSWFVLEGRGANRGSVIDAYCMCLGGRDGGCKHIASALYSLEDLLDSRGENSVTSGPCQWIRKPKPNTTACELKDLEIIGLNKCKEESTTGKRKRDYTFSQYIDHDPRILSDRLPADATQLSSVVSSMETMANEPAILQILKNKLYSKEVQEQPHNMTKECKEDLKLGILEQKLLDHMQRNQETDAQIFLENLNFTDSEQSEV